MPTLADIRQQYPQYNDLSDEALADAFHKKFYSDLSREEFNAKIEPSWGQTFNKAKENTSLDRLAQMSITNPIEDVKNMGKIVLGGAENALGFGPSQQISNEQDVANRFGEHYGNYLSEEGWKKNISEDPTGTLADILTFGRAPARAALSAGRRVITPVPARPGFREASDVLRTEGVPQTAGQRTGSERLKYAESELGGARTSEILDKQKAAYTEAASRRVGANEPSLGPLELEQAYKRVGGEIGNIAKRNTLPPDPQLIPEIASAVNEYQNLVGTPAPIVKNYADFIAKRTKGGTAPLPGDTYQAMRSRLGRYARGATEPYMRNAIYRIQGALDDAFERGLQRTGNQADIQALQIARRQYGNYLTLEKAMKTGGEETARGLVTPAKLEQAASSGSNARGYAHGRSDFTGLAKAGKVGMSRMPESGTSKRLATQAVPAALGAAVGFGGGGGLGAVLGGIAGRYAAGRALMSRPVQAYLGNQLLPQRAPATPGSRTIPPAVAASTRETNLSHAESVLSPEVLAQVKGFAPKELNAWLTTRSPEAAMALAQVIAQKANRPDLVERIVAELGAQ